ncbi:hypothetical protein SZN_16525 [Streptomyces zinciresistens K42]|uniref:DUF5709 domain-containing protein n=1 Tax=Streptomyces zinciresistens K42 TaxID=700597 RepID=G2GCS8_9ACTN|nr:hypothetical protein [Streptomyces zinciresistens]EGX58665.1 hypothetical protein SZN_16525 [Streptomyces zinciresistens K42]
MAAVDPTDPESFAHEEPRDPGDYEDVDATEDAPELGVEAPAADAAEQRADVRSDRDDPLTGADRDRADEGDLAEQARVVATDEDDYR